MSPFFRFSDAEVREIVGCDISDICAERAATFGLEIITTQQERVLALARRKPDVDWIFEQLGRRVERSSIRSYLSRASSRGIIGDEWRKRRRRRVARACA